MRYKLIKARTGLEFEEALNDFMRREMGTILFFTVSEYESMATYVALIQYNPQ